jgi:large subunit ribosomal protein L3
LYKEVFKMPIGLIAKKIGMTRILEDESIQVTVLQIETNTIAQIKTIEKDGYSAVQLSSGHKKRKSRLTKAVAGHFAKANVEPVVLLREFRVTNEEAVNFKVGDEIKVDSFVKGQYVDVVSELTKGKGFQGGVKRHHFRTQDATHGNSLSHRVVGSTGQRQSPGRVFKGKKMPGQMGAVRRTAQNLEIARIDLDRNLILIKGAVPGSAGSHVLIKQTVKGAV